MNVLRLPRYSFRYYLRHPGRFWRTFCSNIHNAYCRVVYGIAPYDIWNLGDHLLRIIPHSLRYLAEQGCSYPGTDEFDTSEKYRNYLINLAEIFDECYKRSTDEDYLNEFANDFHATYHGKHHENAIEIRDKYFERFKELRNEYHTILADCYTKLVKVYDTLWD